MRARAEYLGSDPMIHFLHETVKWERMGVANEMFTANNLQVTTVPPKTNPK